MIYLDNGSTTKLREEVLKFYTKVLTEDYFNPSSPHVGGLNTDNKIKKAKETFLNLLDVHGDIIFTSGGTEANNLAILGSSLDHVLTTKAEHLSVSCPIRKFAKKITYLDLDRGRIDMGQLKELLPGVSLVSLTHTHNETGLRHDINKMGEIIKNHSKAVFHVDGVAAFGKSPGNLSQIDLYSVSSHKIHGPKGVGALFVKKGVKIKPFLYGGDQQRKIRPGTENSTGILGFALAAELACKDMSKTAAYVTALRKALINRLRINYILNEDDCPYVLNLSFPGQKGQVLVNALSMENIYISTGSACSSKTDKNLLGHMGYPKEIWDSSVRITFSGQNSVEESEKTAEALNRLIGNNNEE